MFYIQKDNINKHQRELRLVERENGSVIVESVDVEEQAYEDYYPSDKELVECKFCVFDGLFEHDGFDPTHKKGVWKKGEKRICTVKLSLEAQNNKGVWFICDKDKMSRCHFYEEK